MRIPFKYWRVNVCVCVFFSFPFDRLNYSDGEKGASSVYTEKASIYLYNVCNSLAWRLHHHLFLWKSNHSCFFFILFRLLSILFCAFHQATRIYIEHALCVCVWYVCFAVNMRVLLAIFQEEKKNQFEVSMKSYVCLGYKMFCQCWRLIRSTHRFIPISFALFL